MEGVGWGWGYLIKVQGGVIAEGTDGGQLHQPIILPCSDWLIILQAGGQVERKTGEKRWRTEHEMQRAQRSRQASGRRGDGSELGDGELGEREQGWERRERRKQMLLRDPRGGRWGMHTVLKTYTSPSGA